MIKYIAALLIATSSPIANEIRSDDYAVTSPFRRAHPLSALYAARAFRVWCELGSIDEQLRKLATWVIKEYLRLAE